MKATGVSECDVLVRGNPFGVSTVAHIRSPAGVQLERAQNETNEPHEPHGVTECWPWCLSGCSMVREAIAPRSIRAMSMQPAHTWPLAALVSIYCLSMY